METKKSPESNLENKRITFILMGLVVVLASVYIVLEWTKTDIVTDNYIVMIDGGTEPETLVPISVQDDPQPPKPEPTPNVQINVVPDSEKTGNTDIFKSELKPDEVIALIPQPPIIPPVDTLTGKKGHTVSWAERMPSFPGGEDKMMTFISKSVRYPIIPLENGVQGRVIVEFIVEEDGTITNAKVAKKIEPYLDQEALRIVNLMPKWIPGQQGNHNVRVKMTIPIKFVIKNT